MNIKFSNYPNSVNLGSNGVVPVAIFGSNTFDVHQINLNSITFVNTPIKVKKEIPPTPISTSTPQLPTISVSTTTEPISDITGMKIYRNTEWGFEFQYPEEWKREENYFKNYYSKFNLRVMPIKEEKHTKFPFGINIVLPEFAERSFRGLEKTTSEIVIDDIYGIKYEYQFGGRREIAVILPLDDSRMIIGTDDVQYNIEIFNQILSSFKFLNNKR